mgnify:CR=1 FL=1
MINKIGLHIISMSILGLIFCLIMIIPIYIMVILGFTYESLFKLIQFFIIVELISFPFEIFLKNMIKNVIRYEMINIKICKVLYIIFWITLSFFAMSIVDYFMDSIKSTGVDILVVSIIYSFLALKDITEK